MSRALADNYRCSRSGASCVPAKDRSASQIGPVPTVGIGTVRVASRAIVVADANGVVIVPMNITPQRRRRRRRASKAEAAIRETHRPRPPLAGAQGLGYATAAEGDERWRRLSEAQLARQLEHLHAVRASGVSTSSGGPSHGLGREHRSPGRLSLEYCPRRQPLSIHIALQRARAAACS